MHQRYFWQQFPVPVQRLRPWLLLSLALHAAVFSAPLLHSAAPTLPEPDATVSLAPAPPLPSAAPVLSPVVTATPPALPAPTPQLPPQRVPQAPPVVGRAPAPPQAATPAVPPASPTPSPPAVASPSPASVPSPDPVLAPSPEPPSPYATFPQIEGTTSGCGGRENCWQSADTQWRAIARTLERDLQNQGYAVSQIDFEIETGMRVYRVSKPGEPEYYLNLISTFEQGTVYLISEQLMTAAEIRQAAQRRKEG